MGKQTPLKLSFEPPYETTNNLHRRKQWRLCFRYSDSTIPPLPDSKISCVKPASVAVQAGLCQTCSETTLLVFPLGGSFEYMMKTSHVNLTVWNETKFRKGVMPFAKLFLKFLTYPIISSIHLFKFSIAFFWLLKALQ